MSQLPPSAFQSVPPGPGEEPWVELAEWWPVSSVLVGVSCRVLSCLVSEATPFTATCCYYSCCPRLTPSHRPLFCPCLTFSLFFSFSLFPWTLDRPTTDSPSYLIFIHSRSLLRCRLLSISIFIPR
ncbi:hypothetical protein BO71DRAFT_50709 [Aspergillus ellipticus CBS 707.79]|uniref:Uncharacterized protein n=1 Tax=Aspergillus ellipticus CBS 707.79 TaxID=1448320 RepID=A0A319DLS4_9EURO|nr:hypothetical protein BO71DRAFT_50709 [Aspergillus ellipticus CBS 707.79]